MDAPVARVRRELVRRLGFFRLHALDAELDLEAGADRDALERALAGHVLETAELMGTYER